MTILLGIANTKKCLWNSDADESLKKLITALISGPVLCTPDFEKPFTIQTDASDVGMGAVLTQGFPHYMSRKLTASQKKYSTTERECLAVLEAIDYFRSYVEGSRFKVMTDHASLLWLKKFSDSKSRLMRWALRLQEHDFELV